MRCYNGIFVGVLVYMRFVRRNFRAFFWGANLALILSSNIASAQETEELRVLASWMCKGDNIGLHRQKNGTDGVFSDYVPLKTSSEIHLTSTKTKCLFAKETFYYA